MSNTTNVRVKINKSTGKYEVEVVGHDGVSACSLDLDHSIIEAIASSMGKVTDEDNTQEFYREQAGEVYSKPHKEILTQDQDASQKGDDLNLGFGA